MTQPVSNLKGAAVEEAAIQEFKASLRGDLIRPGDDDYDAARKLYNAMIDKHPAMIARCAGAADVVNAVNFARDNQLLVAVRGGGHSVAGNAMCDGGIVIDLSLMKGIRVDPVRRTVQAEGGVTWGELDRETQAFGLATTGGIVSTTGIAGLTLGGGLGYLMRRYGLACDNLLSVDVVTADGSFLTASADESQDLFWGLRGGGGNFGVATSFEYRLHLVGPIVVGGLALHPLAKAKDVLRFYRDFTRGAPDELTVYAGLLTTPDGDLVVGIIACYNGPVEQGEQVVRPLKEFGPPVADLIGPMPYIEVQTLLNAAYPPGLHQYWKSSFMKAITDDAIDVMINQFATVPSSLSAVAIEHLGGAVSRVSESGTAFSQRNAQYSLIITSVWKDPAEPKANIEWTRGLWEAMQPFLIDAAYVNYLGEGEGEARVRAAYGANYQRLVALKNKYDPTNLFRLNQNIKPTV